MHIRFNTVIDYVNGLKTKKFSGTCKLGFENGALVALTETNRAEIVYPEYRIAPETCISMSNNSLFSGTIMLEFENGIILNCSYVKSYKADTLRQYLGVQR